MAKLKMFKRISFPNSDMNYISDISLHIEVSIITYPTASN